MKKMILAIFLLSTVSVHANPLANFLLLFFGVSAGVKAREEYDKIPRFILTEKVQEITSSNPLLDEAKTKAKEIDPRLEKAIDKTAKFYQKNAAVIAWGCISAYCFTSLLSKYSRANIIKVK